METNSWLQGTLKYFSLFILVHNFILFINFKQRHQRNLQKVVLMKKLIDLKIKKLLSLS